MLTGLLNVSAVRWWLETAMTSDVDVLKAVDADREKAVLNRTEMQKPGYISVGKA
jgi:hypothetical protein